MDPTQVSIWVALSAGLLSFFSPCVLPMVPVYLLYMTGTAADRADETRRWRAMSHAAFFVAGFGLIFVLGGITVGYLGSIMPQVIRYLVNIGGFLLILFGLHMVGLVSIPVLSTERRLDIGVVRGQGYWRSFVVGVVFAAGWTPCIGPALAAIFSLAAMSRTVMSGALLLMAYSAGIAVPFLVVAALSDVSLPWVQRVGKHARLFGQIAGALLIVMGFLLVTGYYQALIFWLNAVAGGL